VNDSTELEKHNATKAHSVAPDTLVRGQLNLWRHLLSGFLNRSINTGTRLIPFDPAAHDVVLQGLPIGNVLVLFRSCQPDGKPIDRCRAKLSTRFFQMKKRVLSIWRNDGGPAALFAPLVAPARAGL